MRVDSDCDDPVDPGALQERVGLWFGHRNVRFFGVTLRKPSDEDAARAAELGAAAAEKAAAAEAERASKRRESEADLSSFPGFDREGLVAFLESFQEADAAHNAGDLEKAAKLFAELVGKLDGNDRHPLSVRALNGLAWELHLLGRDAEALPYARRAAAAAGENAYGIAVRDTLGAVLAAAGETDEARKVLEGTLALADRIFTISKTERKEFRNSRGHLRFHLAPRPPPAPVVRVRVSSRADLEALLNAVAAAAGDPMLGVQAGDRGALRFTAFWDIPT